MAIEILVSVDDDDVLKRSLLSVPSTIFFSAMLSLGSFLGANFLSFYRSLRG